MAWRFTLLPASFAGIRFEVKSVDDDGKNMLVKSAYPYRKGADIENLGRDAHGVPLEIVLWNESEADNYEETLKSLVNAFDGLTPQELVQPIFGVMQVFAEGWKVRHNIDEGFDYCTVSVTFIEAGADMPFFNRSLPSALGGLAGLSALASIDALVTQFESYMDMAYAYLGEASAAVSLLRDYWSRLVTPLFELRSDVLTLGYDVFALPRNALDDVRGLLGMTYTMDKTAFVINAPRQEPQTVNHSGVVIVPTNAQSGYAPIFTRDVALRDLGAAQVAVGAVLNSVRTDALDKLPDTRSFDLKFSGAAVSAGEVAFVMRATLRALDALCAAESVAQVLEWELIDPTLSPAQVESVLNLAREPLRQAVEDVPAAYAGVTVYRAETVDKLKETAWGLIAAARAAINMRPALVQHTVAADTCAHLLAFKLYGDFRRCYELVRLNPHIKNPNVINQGEVLNVYAA